MDSSGLIHRSPSPALHPPDVVAESSSPRLSLGGNSSGGQPNSLQVPQPKGARRSPSPLLLSADKGISSSALLSPSLMNLQEQMTESTVHIDPSHDHDHVLDNSYPYGHHHHDHHDHHSDHHHDHKHNSFSHHHDTNTIDKLKSRYLKQDHPMNDRSHNHHHHHDHHDHHDHTHHYHAHHHNEHASHAHHSHQTTHSTPLPTLSQIFSTLAPAQKTIFTWALFHMLIGFAVWLVGQSSGSLAMVGFSFAIIFDALGVFNIFISSAIASNRAFWSAAVKRPFGFQRFEVLFGFCTLLYLLFGAMYLTKEAIEHLMLDHHEGHHDEDRGLAVSFLMVFLGLAATVIGAIGFQNHLSIASLMRTNAHGGLAQPAFLIQNQSAVSAIVQSPFTLLTFACGFGVMFNAVMELIGYNDGTLDKLSAILQTVLAYYFGWPATIALAKLLLQTAPEGAMLVLEACLRDIRQNPAVLSVDTAHFWQNTYGQLVGTLRVHIRAGADEQAVLAHVHQRLGSLVVGKTVQPGMEWHGELTVEAIRE
ncbi:uncharacterized protein VTP21DRAFT_10650 [Calcarisporiella thermophila]|uniref:uncharacterized protein n=1 Tax=Calcarisporiella thermophila TaxID=911321 RepID=UPI0037420984